MIAAVDRSVAALERHWKALRPVCQVGDLVFELIQKRSSARWVVLCYPVTEGAEILLGFGRDDDIYQFVS
jgi:hypothetical protein